MGRKRYRKKGISPFSDSVFERLQLVLNTLKRRGLVWERVKNILLLDLRSFTINRKFYRAVEQHIFKDLDSLDKFHGLVCMDVGAVMKTSKKISN